MATRNYRIVAGLEDGTEIELFRQGFEVPAEWGRGNSASAPAYIEPFLAGAMSQYGPVNPRTVWIGATYRGFIVAAVNNPWHSGNGGAGVVVENANGLIVEIIMHNVAANPGRNEDLARADFDNRVWQATNNNNGGTIRLFVNGVEVESVSVAVRPVCPGCGSVAADIEGFEVESGLCPDCEWVRAVRANPAAFDFAECSECGALNCIWSASGCGCGVEDSAPAVTGLTLEQTQTLAGFDSAELERAANEFGPMAYMYPDAALGLAAPAPAELLNPAGIAWVEVYAVPGVVDAGYYGLSDSTADALQFALSDALSEMGGVWSIHRDTGEIIESVEWAETYSGFVAPAPAPEPEPAPNFVCGECGESCPDFERSSLDAGLCRVCVEVGILLNLMEASV